MDTKIKVLIADDNAEFLTLLTERLSAEPMIELAGSVSDGTNWYVLRPKPHLIL